MSEVLKAPTIPVGVAMAAWPAPSADTERLAATASAARPGSRSTHISMSAGAMVIFVLSVAFAAGQECTGVECIL